MIARGAFALAVVLCGGGWARAREPPTPPPGRGSGLVDEVRHETVWRRALGYRVY